MPAQLFFSNSPAILLDKLSRNLEWSDPFLPPHIASPTPAMKRWVQMRLAEKRGIVANVDFLQLERTLWQRLEDLDLDHVVAFRKPARLLDEQGLQLLILGLLRRNPPEAVRPYLKKTAADSERGIPAARRLCQLSHKLAGFFREYEYSRVREHGHKGLAHAWKHGEDCFLPSLKKGRFKLVRMRVETLERWQREIYHELFRPGGLRDAMGESLGQYQYTLPQYAEMVLSQERTPFPAESLRAESLQAKRAPPSYHLFGLSHISPFHRSLIQRLADDESLRGRAARFFIYSLNPCAEYWEDVLTPGERRQQQENLFRTKKYAGWRHLETAEKQKLRLSDETLQAEELPDDFQDADTLLEADENPLLSQWGRPGRENIRLWCQITQYDFFEHFREPRSGTLLAAVQQAILRRRGRIPREERVLQDDSLQILACPEIHREVETAHQGILHELLRDPSLRPDDIAVVVPNMSDYRHPLAAVFGRTEEGGPGHVPFNLSDASASSESDYARAVKQIFDLSLGRFSRRDLFGLASNPCFRGGGLDESALKAWGQWTSKLSIFHGFDQEDKRARGYSGEPLHTWTHGLERLVLGTVMEAPREDDHRHFEDVVPYADGDSSDRELLQGFLLVVESLHRDLSPLRENGVKPWSRWLETIDSVFDRYLSCPPDQPVEAYVQAEVRRYLGELKGMDGLESLGGGAGEITAGFSAHSPADSPAGVAAGVAAAIPMDLILSRLEGLKAGREPYLSGGVNVAGFSALRSLPFKLIYVLGLGEGKFPEEEDASTLDLRQYRRVIGEVNPSARNRYLFLETLVCAGAKLRLSYVSRDIQQGKTFQMCSVLNELKDYLDSHVLAAPAFRITQVPLLSRDASLFSAGAALPWDPPPNPFRNERLLAWLERNKAAHPGLLRHIREAAPPSIRSEIFPARPFPDPADPADLEEPSSGNAANPRPERRTGLGAKANADAETMPLEDIRLYLENPVHYALRKRLAIRESREEDPMGQEDEPFFCPFPKEMDLLQTAALRRFTDWENATREDCRRHLRDHYANLTLRGLMPEAYYRDLDREALLEKLEGILEGLDAAFGKLGGEGGQLLCSAGLVLGDGSDRGPGMRLMGKPELRVPPVRLRVSDRVFDLHGGLPCLFRGLKDGGCATVVLMPGELNRKLLLPAFLFYMAGLLSDSPLGEWLRGGPFTIHYVAKKRGRDKHAYENGNWAPFRITREAARTYLAGILASMSGKTDFDLLPFDLIARHLTEGNRLKDGLDYPETLREALDAAEEAGPDWSDFNPTESMRLLDPAVPRDAEAKVRARLESFFNFLPDADGNG